MTPSEIDAFYAAHLKGIARSANGQRYARCPFHDDRKASFSYNIEKGGVWSCHGNCGDGSLYDFCKRMNLPELPKSNGRSSFHEPTTTYDYRDEKGALLYQVVRLVPKDFKQRQPDGKGGWIWNLQGVRRVLYRLPELIKAKLEGLRIFIVEGEKDADRLARLGQAATTNSGGAGKWREEFSQFFEGLNVSVISDNDAPGLEHAQGVAAALFKVAASVNVLTLPGLDIEGGDVSDWLDRGHTIEELLTLAEAGPSSVGIPQVSVLPAPFEPPEAGAWEPPVSFQVYNLPDFPTDCLPDWARRFVEGEALATQTPADLAAMLFFAVVACACQKKVAVLVRFGWIEPVNVFVVIVMPPGCRKTRGFSALEEPLRKFEEDMAQEMAATIAAAETRYKILQGKIQKANAKAAGAEGPEAEALAKQAETLSYEAATTTIPVIPRLIADDVTPERLASMLKEQGGHMAVMSPEGGVFDLMSGRYSKDGSANFEVLLKGHAGDTLRVDRVGRPPEFVSHPALTLGLAVQPEVIGGLARKPGFRGRGLLGRFFYSLPSNLLGRRKIGAPPLPDDIRDVFKERIQNLLLLPFDLDEKNKPKTRLLKLSPAAVKRMLEFEAQIEPQLAEFGALGSMTDWGGKLVGGVARIAGLLHMAEHSDQEAPWDIRISRETVERAIRIGEYLIPHARAAYATMGADPGVEDAKHVLAWIRRQGIADFTKRGLFQSLKGHFKRVSQMEPILALLQEHIFIRRRSEEARPGAGRKPSPVYEVNPLWLSQGSNSEDCGNSEEQVEAPSSGPKINSENSEDSEDGDGGIQPDPNSDAEDSKDSEDTKSVPQINLSKESPLGNDDYPSSWKIELNPKELGFWEPGSDFQDVSGSPAHVPQGPNTTPQYPHNPQNAADQGGYLWPEESLNAERRFGHRSARLYPFVNKRIGSTHGDGVLLKVGDVDVGVELDNARGKMSFLPIEAIWPIAQLNGGAAA